MASAPRPAASSSASTSALVTLVAKASLYYSYARSTHSKNACDPSTAVAQLEFSPLTQTYSGKKPEKSGWAKGSTPWPGVPLS